jgi:transposase InsO family protein
MQLEGKSGLSIVEACDTARLSRAGFYRHFDEHAPRQADTDLREQIQQICLDRRCYGSGRVTAELRAQGRLINRKRIVRLMRADNVLCLRKRRFVCTTDSRHTYAVYPHLTRDGKPAGINQLWVADITYIRLRESFLYLAVILDAYSRRVIGWALEDTLQAQLTIKALRRALEDRPVQASLVHHSDRGVQYCARDYVDLLRSHGVQISMSRAGNPYDNALAESFMRTLKHEEVYSEQRSRSRGCAASHPGLSRTHLQLRTFTLNPWLLNSSSLRSGCPWRPPGGFGVSFLRHPKIYQSDGLEGKLNWPPNFPTDHRSDESSTGYSFMGCSPAEPTSASPVLHSFSLNLAAVQSTAANRNLSLFLLSQHRGPLQCSEPRK